MAEDRTIVSVTGSVTGGGAAIWVVEYRRPDGSLGAHIFPKDTLLWRSIEYGIDLGDVDTLLDVVLHELLIDDPTDPDNFAADPAAKRGHIVAAAGTADAIFGVVTGAGSVPVWLYNAPDVGTARDAHLIRIGHCKQTKAAYSKHTPGQGADPLDTIRGEHRDVITLIEQVPQVRDVYQSMRDHIQDNRELAAGRRGPQIKRHTPWDKGKGGN